MGERAILLVDHGSRRPEANAQLDALAERVAARCPDDIVRVAHLEIARPSIAEGIASCVAAGAREIVVHPYFLGPGRHTQTDIPEQVALAAAEHTDVRVEITEPLGLHPSVIDAVVDRVSPAS